MMFSRQADEWLARAIGAGGDLRIRPMPGTTSSSVYLVRGVSDDMARQAVLRVLDHAAWLAEEPDLAEHEAAALIEAERAALRAPRLIAYAAGDVGFGAPVVLMSLLEGKIELKPANFTAWINNLAGEVSAIHRHRAAGFGWQFRSWVNWVVVAPPAWSTNRSAWARAIEIVRGPAPSSPQVFIHRDYHPTNVLWHAGRVSGVVDWINACQGPAGVDVAHCRTNLAQMYGVEAADRFLGAYCRAADGFDYDPYWDLDSLLDMCLPQPTFYPPWQHFGLEVIPTEIINRRIDAYLESVLARL